MKAAWDALKAIESGMSFEYLDDKIAPELRSALEKRKPLTDDEISILWYESGNQPFKFARMVEELFR